MRWGLVTTAVSTYFLQQDGFPDALGSALRLPDGMVGLALHAAYYVSVAAIATEAARWGIPKFPKLLTSTHRPTASKQAESEGARPTPPVPSQQTQPSAFVAAVAAQAEEGERN